MRMLLLPAPLATRAHMRLQLLRAYIVLAVVYAAARLRMHTMLLVIHAGTASAHVLFSWLLMKTLTT
jgi:hypothetical protein